MKADDGMHHIVIETEIFFPGGMVRRQKVEHVDQAADDPAISPCPEGFPARRRALIEETIVAVIECVLGVVEHVGAGPPFAVRPCEKLVISRDPAQPCPRRRGHEQRVAPGQREGSAGNGNRGLAGEFGHQFIEAPDRWCQFRRIPILFMQGQPRLKHRMVIGMDDALSRTKGHAGAECLHRFLIFLPSPDLGQIEQAEVKGRLRPIGDRVFRGIG
ncbi:MAG: hypothetical protein MUF31_14895 [Akkermansiaceae bacterium]|nr:hypothetical protein [Akkermansiaceae bacterium]